MVTGSVSSDIASTRNTNPKIVDIYTTAYITIIIVPIIFTLLSTLLSFLISHFLALGYISVYVKRQHFCEKYFG